MKWQVGLTTCPARREILPRTLASLKAGGFDELRLFVDGQDASQYGYPVTCRDKVGVVGNWILTLWELWLRDPTADRFVIFQDDILCCKNLRQYLEKCTYPEKGYLNLFLRPSTDGRDRHVNGWQTTEHRGKGALGLVFSQEAVRVLLRQPYLVDKPLDPIRGWKKIDGAVYESMKAAGWSEYVHKPSLIQHTGVESTIDRRNHTLGNQDAFPKFYWPEETFAVDWPGEEFDAMNFLQST